MGTLLQLIFSILKIIGLGYFYSFLTIQCFTYLSKQNAHHWFSRLLNNVPKLKVICRLTYSAGLFIFMFTHWGNRGFGDSSRIPLNYGREIVNIDGTNTYIPETNNRRSDINIERFALTKTIICGEVLGDTIDYAGKYVVFNMKTNQVDFLKDKEQFNKYAIEHNLPTTDKFHDFFYHYGAYWNSWRLFLLA